MQRHRLISPLYGALLLDKRTRLLYYKCFFFFRLEEETKPWLESGEKPEIQPTKPKTYEVVSSRISVVYKPTTQEVPPVLPQVVIKVVFK